MHRRARQDDRLTNDLLSDDRLSDHRLSDHRLSDHRLSDHLFSDDRDLELAAEWLEVRDEPELGRFLWRLLLRAGPRGGAPGAPALPALHALLVDLGRELLALAGRWPARRAAASTRPARPALRAGALLGLELEGLSPEDQELELARRFVRLTASAANAARRARGGASPRAVARAALARAARRHAPGLLPPARPPRRPHDDVHP